MADNPIYKLTYGLFVVTANENGKDNGCITNTVGQVTSEPNRVSLTVNKANLTHDMIMNTGKFTASIISQEADFELIKRFGFQSGREADKFAGLSDIKRVSNGTLAVTQGTNSFISASVCQSIDLGTHTMFIADVGEMAMLGAARSADYAYYLENIKPKPKPVAVTDEGLTVWRCIICGYEYVGEELPEDFVCPLCKHPASDFEKIVYEPGAVPAGVAGDGSIIWRCTICGYEYVGDELPENFICPICGVDYQNFEKKKK